jgi:hypothetical protein
MPYDLYGTYYTSARDAENAEMAQCAAIDANIAYREVEKLKNRMQQPSNYDEQIHCMQQHIQSLEARIEILEEKFSKLQA